MRVVALDPGGTTGFTATVSVGRVYATQLEGTDHHSNLISELERWQPSKVICESIIRLERWHDPKALEYIGLVKYYCSGMRMHGACELVMQRPAQAKTFWTDQKLKQLNMYSKNAPHANDATRHLLYWWTFGLRDNTYVAALKMPNARLRPITIFDSQYPL